MKRDEFGLKPPNHSFVDMIERLSDGVQVEVINRRNADEAPDTPRGTSSAFENNRPFYRSNRAARD
jgi:hypothetical protein